jgi:hypothetical protein
VPHPRRRRAIGPRLIKATFIAAYRNAPLSRADQIILNPLLASNATPLFARPSRQQLPTNGPRRTPPSQDTAVFSAGTRFASALPPAAFPVRLACVNNQRSKHEHK